jgi:hypothetical protein
MDQLMINQLSKACKDCDVQTVRKIINHLQKIGVEVNKESCLSINKLFGKLTNLEFLNAICQGTDKLNDRKKIIMLLMPHMHINAIHNGYYYLCAFGSPELFELFKDIHDSCYYDGFMYACVNGNYDMVKHIFEYNHPTNSTISKALEYTDKYCFTENRAKIIELLVSNGGNIHTKSRYLLERT